MLIYVVKLCLEIYSWNSYKMSVGKIQQSVDYPYLVFHVSCTQITANSELLLWFLLWYVKWQKKT